MCSTDKINSRISPTQFPILINLDSFGKQCECLEHNHDKSKIAISGFLIKMDVLQHYLAGAQSCYVQSTS